MTTGQGDCWKLPVKTTEEDEEEMQEATSSPAVPKEVSVDAAVAAVSSELDDILTLKETQGRLLSVEKDAFALLV